ncbi:MAG: hypothetical protein SGPRY_009346, partial [Prymnesium sp.]
NVRLQPQLDDPSQKEVVNHADLPACARETAAVLATEIEERFDEKKMPMEQMIAMALDPRTSSHVKDLSLEMQQKIYSQVSAEVKELRSFLGNPESRLSMSTSQIIEINDDDDSLDSLSLLPMCPHLKELDEEVLLYFQDPPLEKKAPKDFDPLAWWKAKKESPESPFVALPIIACLYLSLASTAARNERTFSYAGRLLDTLRSTIHNPAGPRVKEGKQPSKPKSKKQKNASPGCPSLDFEQAKEAAEESHEDSDTELATMARSMATDVQTMIDTDVNHTDVDDDDKAVMENDAMIASQLEAESMCWLVDMNE